AARPRALARSLPEDPDVREPGQPARARARDADHPRQSFSAGVAHGDPGRMRRRQRQEGEVHDDESGPRVRMGGPHHGAREGRRAHDERHRTECLVGTVHPGVAAAAVHLLAEPAHSRTAAYGLKTGAATYDRAQTEDTRPKTPD